MGNSRLSHAAAQALLISLSRVQVATVVRWVFLAAIPVVPTMVELVNWPMWVDPPILPSFHVIY
jgi:hypothetical protein